MKETADQPQDIEPEAPDASLVESVADSPFSNMVPAARLGNLLNSIGIEDARPILDGLAESERSNNRALWKLGFRR
jgi:hypothetical protein